MTKTKAILIAIAAFVGAIGVALLAYILGRNPERIFDTLAGAQAEEAQAQAEHLTDQERKASNEQNNREKQAQSNIIDSARGTNSDTVASRIRARLAAKTKTR